MALRSAFVSHWQATGRSSNVIATYRFGGDWLKAAGARNAIENVQENANNNFMIL